MEWRSSSAKKSPVRFLYPASGFPPPKERCGLVFFSLRHSSLFFPGFGTVLRTHLSFFFLRRYGAVYLTAYSFLTNRRSARGVSLPLCLVTKGTAGDNEAPRSGLAFENVMSLSSLFSTLLPEPCYPAFVLNPSNLSTHPLYISCVVL